MRDKISLSIVITSYSLERLSDIHRLLESIKAQSHKPLEVIFVADGPGELAQLVQEHGNLISLPINVLTNMGNIGVNVCRNIGILAAKGDIVGIVDDDTLLFPEWVEDMLKTYVGDPSVIAVTGPAIPLWEDQSMSWFPREFYWMWGSTVWDWEGIRDIRNVGGMNCSFRKDALVRAGLYKVGLGPHGGEEKIKWFDPSGEEVELCLRMRSLMRDSRIVFNSKVRIYHRVQKSRFNLRFMAKRAFRFGYSKHYVADLFREGLRDQPVLDLERDHLKHMARSLPISIVKEFFRSPANAWRKSLVTITGTTFTGLGYLLYHTKLVQK